MEILLSSPLVYAVNSTSRYTGIEKLVSQYAIELSKRHEVSVIARTESEFPSNITHLRAKATGDLYIDAEIHAYQTYQWMMRKFDVIHDFSHSHLASRHMPNLPSLNIFWHAPSLAQYPKAPYNIIALSHWAAREFKRVYHQEARYQQSIVIDTDIYKPDSTPRTNRLFALGVMTPEKGNLLTVQLCQQMGIELDLAGGRPVLGDAPLTEYEKTVRLFCDGEKLKFLGEIADEEKMKLYHSCKAFIYMMPEGYEEVTSHKIQEALLCQTPVICSNAGALPEIIEHGIDGYLCSTEKEFITAIKNVDKLNPLSTLEKNKTKYSIENVCKEYETLYGLVKGGLRW